jgi:hypothetical protein
MNNEFDPDAFWEAFEEDRQDREFFASKIREQEKETNIVEFPLTVKFQLDIKAIEDRISSISVVLDDVMYELKELRRRISKKQ